MRLLAACSLGGAGHLNPLLPFLHAARSNGDEIVVVGPRTLQTMAESAGFAFHAGGEPSEAQVAAIRDQLARAPAAEATVLGNRELFAKLATDALLPDMQRVVEDWAPDIVLREPAEYASAIVAAQRDMPMAQVAISLADAEDGSIDAAAPALEARLPGLVDKLRAAPYLTRFPAQPRPGLVRGNVALPGDTARSVERLTELVAGQFGPAHLRKPWLACC